jgi:hypothetical protein
MTKVCTKCGVEKPFGEFNKRREAKDGLRSSCRICQSIENKKHATKNKERAKERHKKNYPIWFASLSEDRKQELKDRSKKWNENNRDKCNEKTRAWAEKNKEKVRAHNREWSRKHKKERREARQKNIEKLAPCYVRGLIVQKSGLNTVDITPELLNVVTQHIKLKRKLREYKNGTHSKTAQAN